MTDKDKKDKKEEVDPNTVLIPREMIERKKLMATTTLALRPMTPEQAAELHRFDVLPSNPISKEEEKKGYASHYHKDDHEDEEDKKSGKDGKKKNKNVSADDTRHAKDPTRQRYASGACPKCGRKDGVSKITVTGENYLHLYMEQQKQTREQQLRMASENAGNTEATKKENERKELEKMNERMRENEMRVRAHDLQDQIMTWKQKKGQGEYDDTSIDNVLAPLETELNTIPTTFWK